MTSQSPLDRFAGAQPISSQKNLPTRDLGPDVWDVLSKCHDMRSRTEYEGALGVDERLVLDLIAVVPQGGQEGKRAAGHSGIVRELWARTDAGAGSRMVIAGSVSATSPG